MYYEQIMKVLGMMVGMTDEELKWGLVTLLGYALKGADYPLYELVDFNEIARQANVFYELRLTDESPDWRKADETRLAGVEVINVSCADYVEPPYMTILKAHYALEITLCNFYGE